MTTDPIIVVKIAIIKIMCRKFWKLSIDIENASFIQHLLFISLCLRCQNLGDIS